MVNLINLPEGVAGAVGKSPLIIGVGPSAWPRIIPGLFFPKYKIISYVDCLDNRLIRDLGLSVFSIKEEDPYFEISPESPGRILDNEISLKYLRSLEKPFVFLVYKSSLTLEKFCDREGWKFLGSRRDLAENFVENKKTFKEVLRKIGLESIPGENIPIENLTEEKLFYYQKIFGQEKLVLQLAEMTYGGGSGTLFVNEPQGLSEFGERVMEIRKSLVGKKKKIETVNVAPFITGISASITCCATKYGVLTGPIQTQIIDIDEVGTVLSGRSGNFAGHDWSFRHYSQDIRNQAIKIAERFGEYIYQEGYKGIFGLDLIIDKNGHVWPVECNPRYTDAFPLVSMLQIEKGLIPFDILHCLEHLESDYRIDINKMNKYSEQIYEASQILIHSKIDGASVALGSLSAGIYKMRKNKLEYLRSGIMLTDLTSEDEYLFTERVPDKSGRVCYPKGRIFRIVKRGGMLASEAKLKGNVSQLISQIYKKLRIVEANSGLKDNHGLKTLFTYKLLGAREDLKLGSCDMVNVLGSTDSGFRRPYKICWRKDLADNIPIIGQIRSKRARKQINSDIRRLSLLGIEIKTIPEINQKEFSEWLGIYKKIISSKEKGFVLLDNNWLKRKIEKGKKAGAIFAYRNGNIIGGNVFLEINKILGVGYGVSEKIPEFTGGLSLLLDYFFLEYAQKAGHFKVSFGQDTNLYGHDLSVGLLAYKAKLGFTPFKANKTYSVTTYFLNFEDFDDSIMFFSEKGNDLELNVITKERNEIELRAYLPQGIKRGNIFQSDKVVKEHRRLLLE